MKILYHIPSLKTIYAGRTIYHGYKNAFQSLGHEFRPFTSNDSLITTLESFNPDVFITATHFYYQRFLNHQVLKKFRDQGLVVFVNIDAWRSGLNISRINEARSLKDNKKIQLLLKEGLLGDIFIQAIEQDDYRMEGFEREMGCKYHTIPLAADDSVLFPEFVKDYATDIAYVGTYLPQKRKIFHEEVFPLRKKYRLDLYGQDWTVTSRLAGWGQRFGQLFNVPILRSLQKQTLELSDERKIYSSAKILINIHEDYQRHFGGDCNERTFKIPLCSGFEIVDNVKCIKKYFKEDEEIVVALNKADWFDKIDHYFRYPEDKLKIIEAGHQRVKTDHTYKNRVWELLRLYKSFKDGSIRNL